jgi:primosomal replication protein N
LPAVGLEINHFSLTAGVAEVDALRYTPSGVPALNCKLEHASEVTEAGQVRQVKAVMKSVCFGSVAESLSRQDIGSHWRFTGFLATPRGTKQLVFHIQEFVKD